MRELDVGSGVLYGYTPPLMEDIVNLLLVYDKVCDYDGSLESLKAPAKILAQHFAGDKLAFEDVRGWCFDEIFIMINSISEYHGVDLKKLNLPNHHRIMQGLLWLDESSYIRKADCERFIKVIDGYFHLLHKNNPTVAEKVVNTLGNLYKLFDEGVIVSREGFLPEIMKARKATLDMAGDATDRDMEDEAFVSLVSWMDNKDNQWWTSFTLNVQLLESSYLGIPLHVWDIDLPLVEYKYQRGARYLPELRKMKVVRDAFSVLIPEVYILDVLDLLKVRDSPEFSNFRREVNRVYREVLENPQGFPDANSLTEYLKSNYFSQLEQLALERRPKPGTVLLKKLVAGVHPIVGLVIGGEEVYKEYRDKYKTWKFAVSTLEMKGKLQTLARRRQAHIASLK